jgi:hypothetical protein
MLHLVGNTSRGICLQLVHHITVDLRGIKFWLAASRHVAEGMSSDAANLVSCLFVCVLHQNSKQIISRPKRR